MAKNRGVPDFAHTQLYAFLFWLIEYAGNGRTP